LFTVALTRRCVDIYYARRLTRDLLSRSGFAGAAATDNNAVFARIRLDDKLKKPFSVGTIDEFFIAAGTVGCIQHGIYASLSLPVVVPGVG